MIGRTIDRIVEVFSPELGVKRRACRDILALEKRQYAAAKTPRTSDGWRPVDPANVNDLITGSASIVRGRVRQLVRDFPYFARAVNVLTNLTVGTGITVQARVKDPDGNLASGICSAIEDGFDRWNEQADVAGRLCFYELMELAKRNMLETGEYLFVKRHIKGPGRFLPFALQAMEPDRLSGYAVNPSPGNLMYDGVEVDGVTGQPVFYHFAANDYGMKPFRVPASEVIHGFKARRPGQLRGISDFTPVVLLANDFADFMDANLDRARLASKWLAFIKTPNPLGYQQGRNVSDETYKRIEDIENAMIEYLRPGEEVELSNGAMPGETFDPYVKIILHMIAIGCGVSYELLSGDYSGTNYSTLRGVRNDLAKDIEPHQVEMVRHFCRPVYRDVFDMLVMRGAVPVPISKYLEDPRFFQRAVWMPPGMESVDPLKESKANTDQVQNLLRSPQEICRSRGRDIEDVLDELKEFKRMCAERGLEPVATSTAIAQNPASLGVEE